ncbi:hypothetical protein BT63DRAFT_459014 [Microthyrium microscopicum]|uniref:DUF7703 domain-containing protein n=1 Tax=Microthyrium microscopicum TaxID=703497 RepID=A0A6A6TZC2_9PEZI|nr:hypothetical protein BT63DRAFT_459014 [Microthyrium microscopicum]
MSSICIFDLAILIGTTWDRKARQYYWSLALATFFSFCVTVSVLVFFFASPPTSKGFANQTFAVALSTIGYVLYVPSDFVVKYTRLHFLGTSRRTLLICRIILICEWIFITIPNTVIAAGAGVTEKYRFPQAYATTQRLEPAVYAIVSIMVSSLYVYHAHMMFRGHREKSSKQMLSRLLYSNALLVALHVGNLVAEYTGTATVQTGYIAFLYSFQLKIELFMLKNIGKCTSESLERSRTLRPQAIETGETGSYE